MPGLCCHCKLLQGEYHLLLGKGSRHAAACGLNPANTCTPSPPLHLIQIACRAAREAEAKRAEAQRQLMADSAKLAVLLKRTRAVKVRSDAAALGSFGQLPCGLF